MSVMIEDATLSLTELKAKFMKLLETDRSSEEFETLFAEVDADLAECIGEYGEELTA